MHYPTTITDTTDETVAERLEAVTGATDLAAMAGEVTEWLERDDGQSHYAERWSCLQGHVARVFRRATLDELKAADHDGLVALVARTYGTTAHMVQGAPVADDFELFAYWVRLVAEALPVATR